MKQYFVVLSSNSVETGDMSHMTDLSQGLAHDGHEVTCLLVQNAVFSARSAARCTSVGEFLKAGVRVLADEFSLLERGIDPKELKTGVNPTPLDVVVEALADGTQVLWH